MLAAALLCLSLLPAPTDAWAPGRLMPAGRLGRLRVDDGAALAGQLPVSLLERLDLEGKLVAELRRFRAEGGEPADELFATLLGGCFEVALYDRASGRLREGGGDGRLELLLVARPPDVDAAADLLDAWAADADASQPVSRGHYRGRSYLRIGRALVVTLLDDLLALASDDDLLADAIDRSLDGAWLTAGQGPPPGGASLSLSPDLARRARLQLGAPLRRRLGIPGSALLNLTLGPVAAALDGDDWLHLDLTLLDHGFELLGHVPASPALDEPCWFPPEARDAAPLPAQALAHLRLTRDLADWWRRRESLLPADDQARLARLDEAVSDLLGGASPAEDLLARLGHDVGVVVDRDAEGRPAACLVLTLTDGVDLDDALAVALQTGLVLLNVERADAGGPALLLTRESHRGVALIGSRPVATLAERGAAIDDAPLVMPTLARVGGRLLLGTSTSHVRAVVDALLDGATDAATGAPHLALELDVAALAALGDAWRPVLVARALLEQGLDPVAAGESVDAVLDRLRELGRLSLELAPASDGLQLRLGTRGPAEAASR